MSKFMILYRAPESARDQLANATPEQRQAGAEAWRAWASRVDYAIADLGTPLAHTTHIGPGAPSADGICGYSILKAGLGRGGRDHPHRQPPARLPRRLGRGPRDHPDRRHLTPAPHPTHPVTAHSPSHHPLTPRSCAVRASCSVMGAIRPERHTITHAVRIVGLAEGERVRQSDPATP